MDRDRAGAQIFEAALEGLPGVRTGCAVAVGLPHDRPMLASAGIDVSSSAV
jgi:hypothetical protein